ncbi:MAG TPA: hypothetical protein VGX28_01950 [Frankiaceae bacterium]|jgi:hypothetical protein|nr:hypothetical protein [Frankiaceae bacterium]
MARTETLSRTMHDVGLAAWFGGSLKDAVDPRASAGPMPLNAAAIGAHVLGALELTWANKKRIKDQKGVATTALVKAGVTGAALVATAFAQRKPAARWAVPALTGAMLSLNALMGEQQRPKEVAKGVFQRYVPGL